MKTKTFDCVEMKHKGAEKVREQIGGMAPEQELAFWQERSRILRQRQESVREKQRAPKPEESQAP